MKAVSRIRQMDFIVPATTDGNIIYRLRNEAARRRTFEAARYECEGYTSPGMLELAELLGDAADLIEELLSDRRI